MPIPGTVAASPDASAIVEAPLGKSPAFQFYPKDYQADENVRAMTHEERGIYVDLLCLYWVSGSLPNDIRRLSRMVSLPQPHFEMCWEAIQPCFKPTEDGQRLTQKRMDAEREKQLRYRQAQSEKGKLGGRPRKNPEVTHGEGSARPGETRGFRAANQMHAQGEAMQFADHSLHAAATVTGGSAPASGAVKRPRNKAAANARPAPRLGHDPAALATDEQAYADLETAFEVHWLRVFGGPAPTKAIRQALNYGKGGGTTWVALTPEMQAQAISMVEPYLVSKKDATWALKDLNTYYAGLGGWAGKVAVQQEQAAMADMTAGERAAYRAYVVATEGR